MSHRLSCRRLAILAVASVASVATNVAPALADAQCPAASVSNPFAQWGDNADYMLVGNVEDSGASWALTGGAGAQSGNETFMVGGAGDSHSLRLPAGGSATTARVCIDSRHPSFRFFLKQTAGNADASLLVEVVYAGADGVEHAQQAGVVTGSDDWRPSSSLPTVVDALAAQNGGAISAGFRFTPQGGSLWAIDDVYVDPHRVI